MNHYFDIKIIPDLEMPLNWIVNALYAKLHKVLVDINSHSIGVSFPKYKVLLGDVIRLHGSVSDLEDLKSQNWIGGLIGYCHISDTLPVPTACQYRTVSRIQPKMSQSKIKRLIKRNSQTDIDLKAIKAKMFSTSLSEPYIELVSSTNGHKYRRYFKFGNLQEFPQEGAFDGFGLSKLATVPWF